MKIITIGITPPSSAPAAQFGALRAGGRLHPAVDYYAAEGTPVCLPVQTEVVRSAYEFYRGAFAVDLLTADKKLIIRVCEITAVPRPVGTIIAAGEIIGRTARMVGIPQCMAHVETSIYDDLIAAGYIPGQSLTVPNNPPYYRRPGLVPPLSVFPSLVQQT